MQASGGFVIHKQPLVRTGVQRHTAALERPVSQLDLDALNAVQSTPWRINTWLLDVMREGWVADVGFAGLEKARQRSLPDRMADDVFAALNEEDRRAYFTRRSEIHQSNASAVGREQALLDVLSVGEDLRHQSAIYFPHSRCFRGRIHPLPCVGPHPQGSDMAKAVLMFASGLPLGADGLFWLCVRAAGCAGQDKLPLVDRVQWTLEHADHITASAADPWGFTWWTEMDEPWSFLATCRELAEALTMEDPSQFVSHLPVPLDGTCNGLQHLSAMGLDPVGARATNLCADVPRQDIYEEVAKVVRARVETDAAAGRTEAMHWLGRITRKVVKRAVMTTPYGVTDRGIRTQLINDGHVPADGEDRGPAADYLRDCLVDALGQTVQSARSIMAWLQTCAFRLAEAGYAFDWITPTGSKVRQAYHSMQSKRIVTLCGKLALDVEADNAPLTPRKQALGAAPNVIHSFDAAHLSLTVKAAHEEGMRSFAMIHDSYGVHASNTTALGVILRDTFVSIYETDWIAKIADYVQSYAPGVELPELPARGGFEVGQVRDATFFFS